MRDFGEYVGLAFQIRDDLLDYIGRRSITGKPTGLDLHEKKLTLPLIFALRQAPKSDAKQILGMIRAGGKKMNVKRIVDFVKDLGGLDYADKRAREFSAKAVDQLSLLPPSASHTSLASFATFVIDREK